MRPVQHETLPLALYRLYNCYWTSVDQLCGLWCLKKSINCVFWGSMHDMILQWHGLATMSNWLQSPAAISGSLFRNVTSIQSHAAGTQRRGYIKENKKTENYSLAVVCLHIQVAVARLWRTCSFLTILEIVTLWSQICFIFPSGFCGGFALPYMNSSHISTVYMKHHVT